MITPITSYLIRIEDAKGDKMLVHKTSNGGLHVEMRAAHGEVVLTEQDKKTLIEFLSTPRE